MRATVIAAFVFLLVAAPAGAERGRKAVEPLDASLREVVQRVPVAAAGAQIVVTSFRPRGDGPFPWLVLSHGTAPTLEANRKMRRYRPLAPVREWVRRGYAVLLPVRRGYGVSGDGGAHLGDAYGSCANPDYRRAGEGAALDLLATVEWAKTQRDLDPKRWLLVGQSAGGFASIYTASKRPDGLVAVLAFSPGRGGGEPSQHPGEPCAADRMAKLFSSIASLIDVPVLWFYAENDVYMGPRVRTLWFESFKVAGGRGELIVVPPFPDRLGHGVFPSPKGTLLWTAAVSRFFKSQAIALPF
jgi:dienelactone hydrolase